MRLKNSLSAAFLLMVNLGLLRGQEQENSCCSLVKHHSYTYVLVHNNRSNVMQEFNCMDSCEYRRANDSSEETWCFQVGANEDLPNLCLDNSAARTEITNRALTTNKLSGITTASTTTEDTAAYCQIDQFHTMCRFKGPSEECKNRLIQRGFQEDAKASIVQRHNTLRARVANGLEKDQPRAANMRYLEWDDELERVAQRWADQCSFQHDIVRRLLDGTVVGQNIFQSWNLRRTDMNLVEQYNLSKDAIKNWYDEVKQFDPHLIYPFNFMSNTGHYTQVVWAETDRIGCGFAYFQAISEGYNSLVVCNYGKSGNIHGGNMYRRGAPCSQCPKWLNQCKGGLCARS